MMKKLLLILLCLPIIGFGQNDCGEEPREPKRPSHQTPFQFKQNKKYKEWKSEYNTWKDCQDGIPVSKSKNSIKSFVEIDQPLNEDINAGIGSTMIMINKKKSLKNAFGKADIFGRKTDLGYVELTYG